MLHLGGLPGLAGSLRDKSGRVKNADLDCARFDRQPPDSSTELEGEARKGVESGHSAQCDPPRSVGFCQRLRLSCWNEKVHNKNIKTKKKKIESYRGPSSAGVIDRVKVMFLNRMAPRREGWWLKKSWFRARRSEMKKNRKVYPPLVPACVMQPGSVRCCRLPDRAQHNREIPLSPRSIPSTGISQGAFATGFGLAIGPVIGSPSMYRRCGIQIRKSRPLCENAT